MRGIKESLFLRRQGSEHCGGDAARPRLGRAPLLFSASNCESRDKATLGRRVLRPPPRRLVLKTPLLLRRRTNCQRRSFTRTCARPTPINHLRLVLPARLAKSPLPDAFWQETSRTRPDVRSAFCL